MVIVMVGVIIIMEVLVSLRIVMGVGVGLVGVVLTSPPPPLTTYLTVKEDARSLLPR